MTAFIARRLAQAVVTLLVAAMLFHAALSVLPGDPIRGLFGPVRPDPRVLAALRAEYHLDDPWLVQYARRVVDLATGEWGHSFPGRARNHVVVGPPIRVLVAASVPVSLRLLAVAVAAQVVLGLALGVHAARHARRWSARAVSAVALLAVSTPVIVAAFGLQTALGWPRGPLPPTGVSFGWRSYLLPVVVLSLGATAYVVLLVRSQLEEVLREHFVTAARGRGLSERRIVGVHALRVAVVPVVAFVAANLGQLLAALVLVEGIFDVPGFGNLVFLAVQRRDTPLLMTLLTLATAFVLVASVVADLLQARIDARVRL